MKREKATQVIPLRFASQDTSIDMHLDLLRSPLELNFTWPEILAWVT